MKRGLTRRQVLTGSAVAAAAGAALGLDRRLGALSQVVLGPRADRDALVVVFLRGGADSLNVVAPWGDDDYGRLRPTLALASPRDRSAPAAARALDLDGFFGLHPALAPLLPEYREGRLAIVHAVGSDDRTRSHFEAMAAVERGLATSAGAAGGWLARHLAATAGPGDSALRAVAVTDTMPELLRGAVGATLLTSVDEYRLHAPPGGRDRAAALRGALRDLYSLQPANDAERAAVASGHRALEAMEAVARIDAARTPPANGAAYPAGEFGSAMRQVALLARAEVGLEVACVDLGGWDTHVGQGRDTGWMPLRLADLGQGLGAFVRDMGGRMDRTLVVVLSEFGRRAYENSGLGTDHGRAGCMLLLGGGAAGGRVHGTWPGLDPGSLEEPGDLRVTTDYRDVLAEVLTMRAGTPDAARVFPGLAPRDLGVVRPLAAG